MENPAAAALPSFRQLVPMAMLLLAGCAGLGGPQSVNVALSGTQEVPPVTSAASGSGRFTLDADHSLSGGIRTNGIAATAAHIHEGAAGTNGPVVITLTKSSDDAFAVPPGARLTDAQYASFRAGKLYVNVHSDAHPAGEVRGQITPPPEPPLRSYGY